MSKDLTKLSRKQLESKLAKKYGVDRYLNQRSQLLDLLGTKGETDIESGFTGPETEALSIIFENTNKAEGGIISLAVGSGGVGSEDDDDYSGSGPSADETGSANEGDMGASGGAGDDSSDNDESNEVSERGDVFGAGPTQYGKDFTQQQIDAYTREVDRNPQLKGFLGRNIKSKIADKNFDIERNKDGMITGVYSQAQMPGLLGALIGKGTVYTGYGKGFDDMQMSGDDSDEPSEMIKKIVEEQKEEDIPLTEAEIDYYTRGMGTATKPLKSLSDVNEYMSTLVGSTASPTGAKLSKDKKFLILPNGKIINLRTGKVQESMSGLELFRGGLI
jgi:hypothetical protein